MLSCSLGGSVSDNDESFLEACGMCFAFRVRPDAMIPSCQHSCYLECRSLGEARICNAAQLANPTLDEVEVVGFTYSPCASSSLLASCSHTTKAYWSCSINNMSFELLVLNRKRFIIQLHDLISTELTLRSSEICDNAGTGGPTTFKIIHLSIGLLYLLNGFRELKEKSSVWRGVSTSSTILHC